MEVLKDITVFLVYAVLLYVAYRFAFRADPPVIRWAFRIGFLIAIVLYTLILLGVGIF